MARFPFRTCGFAASGSPTEFMSGSRRARAVYRGASRTPSFPKTSSRNKKVDLGNANTAIDRHCEEPLRRSNPGAACCGPWIASPRSQ